MRGENYYSYNLSYTLMELELTLFHPPFCKNTVTQLIVFSPKTEPHMGQSPRILFSISVYIRSFQSPTVENIQRV